MKKTLNKGSFRILSIQKLYEYFLTKNKSFTFQNSKNKKKIKDIVLGTIERDEMIKDIINENLKKDINIKRTELLLLIILKAAIFEFLYKHKVPIKVVISEYLNVANFFLNRSQVKFLNALLSKLGKTIRIT